MAIFSCFSTLVRRKKKKVKDEHVSTPKIQSIIGLKTLKVKLEHPVNPSEYNELKSTSFCVPVPIDIPEDSSCNVKLMNTSEPPVEEAEEVAYEGEDERCDESPFSRENSDSNLQEACKVDSSNPCFELGSPSFTDVEPQGHEIELCENGHGHVSDPGMVREECWDLPRLTRSCSALDTREVLKKIADQLPLSKDQSFEELQKLASRTRDDVLMGSPCSQSSVLTHRSADKVMLKKHSSSQILPSRNKSLWWKLFLWSHRNLQKPEVPPKTRVSLLDSTNQQGGYSSDTLDLEPYRAEQLRGSVSEQCSNNEENNSGFKDGFSGLWPQNQWIAFSGESSSSFKRVDDWVNDIDIHPTSSSFEEECNREVFFPASPEASGSGLKNMTHLTHHNKIHTSDELLYANSVIQSLNSSSSVAHISGMGLKAIPMISLYSSLRSINLSNNSIVQITQGSLPKGLHTLDLSRNKISTIEGLKDLTRLRVLDLSYNRISRIGHGLSSCALLKELYIAGNKISEVEGQHRLLKLTVLDLSFNKITTAKALGQLVSNYHSLVALNILGNPIHSNLSSEQLRRAVCGLLPKLVYLNKQPVNHQKAREVSMDIAAKSSSRNHGWNARRKPAKRSRQNGAMLSSATRSTVNVGQRSKNKLKGQVNQHSRLRQ